MNAKDIGVGISREQFVDFLNSIRGGQFFIVRGYVNAEGEKSDHILRFGIRYGNLKDRDVALLRAVVAGERTFEVKVTQGVWIPTERLTNAGLTPVNPSDEDVWVEAKFTHVLTDGTALPVTIAQHMNLLDVETFGNRKAKDKTQVTLSYALPSNHPLVVAAIGESDLIGTLLQGLIAPNQATVEYDKQAQSCYSLEKPDQPARWYIRDVLAVKKVVRVQADYPFSASIPINAVKKAISSQFLLTGKYRQFILTDGQFESITIEGQAVLVDGVEEQFYFALPEAAHAEARAEATTETTETTGTV